ncbi:hypothetical protein G5B30_16505 [Sphingobacterium sp. SGG-5]|uniref:hypothetical protein n=1 Tax=Sphingobacterium sp. SGG-5 TaxID=2710881 RepID=UPI0013EA0873|nr:hypothetical protein [Sphingobacterium sp. SGG-5]NGM63512.1 hypothetical protein [Sphingobacterium sp. SGG-5]
MSTQVNTPTNGFGLTDVDHVEDVKQSLLFLNDYDESHFSTIDLLFELLDDQLGNIMDALDKEHPDHPLISNLCNISRMADLIRKQVPYDLFVNIDTVVYFLHTQYQNR